MAVSWEFTIEPINIPNKIVSVSATRTDDAAENPDPTYTVTLRNADISTPEKRLEALNTLWAKYLKKVAENTALEAIQVEIDALEASAKTNFEGRES